MDELLDARLRYLDRQAEAGTERESRELADRFHATLLEIVTGRLHEGLRSLGAGFDDRLMQARRALTVKLARQRGMGATTDATREYREDVVRIVLDAIAAEDEAERIVSDARAPARRTDSLGNARADGDIVISSRVVSIDRSPDSVQANVDRLYAERDARRAAGIADPVGDTIAPAAQEAPVADTPVLPTPDEQTRASDERVATYDAKVSNAWRGK